VERFVRGDANPMVCLFDDIHEADPSVQRWLWDEFLVSLPQDLEGRIVVVITTHKKPNLNTRHLLAEINELSRESVERYGREYGITSFRSLITLWCLSEYGAPHRLAWALNATLEIEKRLASENRAKIEESLQTQLDVHQRNLHYLLERAAKFGKLNLPLSLKNEIDEEREEIAHLKSELNRLRNENLGEDGDHE
jgi:hypothetical protein